MSYGDNAYIYLRKKILDWQWYNDTPTRSVFIHCLLRASWKDAEYKGIKYGRGQLIDSNETMARDLGISIQSVKTALDHLRTSGELTSCKVGKNRIITVVKYDMYQQPNLIPNLELTSNQPESNLEVTSYKEIKEDKEVKEVKKDLSNDKSDISPVSHHKKIVDEWNTLSDLGIKSLRSITPNSNRERNLKARLKEFGEDSFKEIVDHIRHSKYLQGKVNGWKVDFDWVVLPSNYQKVLDGKYDDKAESNPQSFNIDEFLRGIKDDI